MSRLKWPPWSPVQCCLPGHSTGLLGMEGSMQLWHGSSRSFSLLCHWVTATTELLGGQHPQWIILSKLLGTSNNTGQEKMQHTERNACIPLPRHKVGRHGSRSQQDPVVLPIDSSPQLIPVGGFKSSQEGTSLVVPLAKTPSCPCRGPRFDPWSEN